MIILTETEIKEAIQLTLDEISDMVESVQGEAFREKLDDCFPMEFSFFSAIEKRCIDKITDQNIRRGEKERINGEMEKLSTILRTMRF